MKKKLLLFLIVICAFTVFATKNEFSFRFEPMAIQITTKPDDHVTSKYGIGSEVTYKRFLVEGLFAEGGLGWNTYLLPDERPNLTSLMFFGGVGYEQKISKMVNVSVHIALGGDTLIYDKAGSETITLKTGVDFGLLLSEKFTATIGCDGSFGFAKKDGINYVNYRILPMIGMDYKF